MKIIVSKRTSKLVNNFQKKEWIDIDVEHYGKVIKDAYKKEEFFLKILDGKEIIGTLHCDILGGVAYVNAIIIAKDKRGKGLGKQLMLKAESEVKKRGAHKIYLVTGKNWSAVYLYKSLGYSTIVELPDHYLHHDFIEMVKFL